jgi:hypothetical protein
LFTDSEGILHGVSVDAESLYEAVAIAVASFREDDVSPSSPGGKMGPRPSKHLMIITSASWIFGSELMDAPRRVVYSAAIATLFS